MRRGTEIALTTLGLGIAVGFAVAITIGAMATEEAAPPPDDKAATDAAPKDTEAGPRVTDPARRTHVVDAVEKVSPTVVSITTTAPTRDLFARFQGRTVQSTGGSGVVIDTSGVILTNAHVVAHARKIEVSFADGRTAEATILGLAEDLDLAVLRISELDGLTAVEIGSSADLLLGEPVIAIGSPFGLGHTVTTGVISATKRAVNTDRRVFQDFIQTDASINPGNSGGPLLNANGKLIGINSLLREDSEGIGFAIPVDRAIKVAKDLVETGQVQIPWLGITLLDVPLRVERVIPNGPGELAGLKPGDVLLKAEDHVIQGRRDLNTYLVGVPDGTPLALTIRRGGIEQAVSTTPVTITDQAIDQVITTSLGVTFKQASTPYGPVLQVTAIRRGTFARFGVDIGDICLNINGQRMSSLQTIRDVLRHALTQHRPTALFYIVRSASQSGRYYMPL